jgi:hypothetical protein
LIFSVAISTYATVNTTTAIQESVLIVCLPDPASRHHPPTRLPGTPVAQSTDGSRWEDAGTERAREDDR